MGSKLSVPEKVQRNTSLKHKKITSKSIASSLILTIILLASLCSVIFSSEISPARAQTHTWVVDDDSPADFSSIQAAINESASGDTIQVHPGLYLENVVINKSVFVTGENASTCVIDGNFHGTVVNITASNVLFGGFTVKNSGSTLQNNYGICVKSASGIRLESNSIINNHKSTFNHYINIGYQTYLNDQQVINRFLKRRFEIVRIGDVRQAIYLTEPLLRDSDIAIFDISAVRQSDAPGTISPSPNGFYGEEICLLARYSGISDKLKIFGLFEVNPDLDIRNQTSGLAAQIIWFFFEGFSQKQYETPALGPGNEGRFTKYHVRITDLDDDLIFVKSNLTDRWWMEIETGKDQNTCIACSHDDYIRANRNEVPDRWVRAVERLKS